MLSLKYGLAKVDKRLNKSRGSLYIKYALLDTIKSKKTRWNFNLATVKLVLSCNPRNPPSGLGTNMKTRLNKRVIIFRLREDAKWHVFVTT